MNSGQMERSEILTYIENSLNPMFIIASIEDTDREGWSCKALEESIHHPVTFVRWHTSVQKAICVRLPDGAEIYLSYKDLRIFDESTLDKPKESFYFDLENLCI